jgi:TfoX/Sxy family transcriptional regulator of competence genes
MMPVAYNDELAGRIRAALTRHPSLREVNMFGGLSFMVNEKMVVCATTDGDLLVRIDPRRADELLARPEARPAEMGAGRSMGKGWISVAREALVATETLTFWLEVALAYNDQQVGTASGSRSESG